MNESKWGLFVPTLKRKNPSILTMLDLDKSIEINLCCRAEEIDVGFYDEPQFNDPRIHIINLGYGLTDLGETRERILEHCKQNNITYCFMFDDGIWSVNDTEYLDLPISGVFENIMYMMKHDKFTDHAIGFTFVKRKYMNPKDGIICVKRNRSLPDRNYFLTYPGQAICINVKLAKKYNIHYHSMNDVGFEDAAFFGDTIKAGLVWLGRKTITIDGIVPNAPKKGGSHHDNFNVEKKYDLMNKRTLKYLNMMGIYLTKQYHQYVGGYCSFICWDFKFFYEVLCTERKQNSKIIKSKFSLGENDEHNAS